MYYSFIGGTYGRIIGKAMVDLFGVHTEGEWAWMDPGAFALIGAASFFGGVSRLTMSLTVIMVRAVYLYQISPYHQMAKCLVS
jgi:chloride channel 7